VGIHVTTIKHTEFVSTKKLVLNSKLVYIMGYISCFQKRVYFHQEGIQYSTTHKYRIDYRDNN